MKSTVKALLIACATCVLLFTWRATTYQSLNYWYLNWNLFLAWLPLLFSLLLVRFTKNAPWLSWPGIVLTLLWLGFLPNSFYIVTDLIHLQYESTTTILFDVVMLMAFSLTGFLLGYISIHNVHQLLLKRVKRSTAHAAIAVVFILCSFAIYLGRYLRWNTWDVLINPAGLLFDVSDRFINPASHGQTFLTTAFFFVFLGAVYTVAWQLLTPHRKTR